MQRTGEEGGKERMEYEKEGRTEEGRSHTSGDGKTVRINPGAFALFCCLRVLLPRRGTVHLHLHAQYHDSIPEVLPFPRTKKLKI